MPPTEHEQLIQLVAAHPHAALHLLGPTLGPPNAPIVALRADTTQASPVIRRADLVLRFGEGKESTVVIIEVQSAYDPRKARTWPGYVTGVWDQQQLPTKLVVLTLNLEVERLSGLPIITGHPGFDLVPIVLGPSKIPSDPADVAGDPMLAVLSVMAHGHGPNGFELARTAVQGLLCVDETERREYTPVVWRSLLPPARALLEALMRQEPTYKGTFFEQFVDEGIRIGKHEGWQEGRQKGRQEGRQEGAILALRTNLLAYLANRWPELELDTIADAAQHADDPTINAAQRFVWNAEDSPAARARLLEILTGGETTRSPSEP